MNDFRIIQKPSAGKDEAYGQEETRRNREGYGHTAEALQFRQGCLGAQLGLDGHPQKGTCSSDPVLGGAEEEPARPSRKQGETRELRASKVRRTRRQLHGKHLHMETALPPLSLIQFLIEGYRNPRGAPTAQKDVDQPQTQPLGAPQTQQYSAVHNCSTLGNCSATSALGVFMQRSAGSAAYEIHVLD